MGSKKTHDGAEKVYEAAQRWVDRALRADGSLFTPGNDIWSSRWLGELRTRFLDRPDEGGDTFLEKLQRQLEGSPPQVYQLMGEALYCYFLVVWTKDSANEQRVIDAVLGWSPAPVAIPPDLVAGLTPGIANPGVAFHTYRPFQVGFLIEFAEQFKAREPGDQKRLLHDPWEFKDFLLAMRCRSQLLQDNQNTPRIQRQALLHLVHPDAFEGTVSVEQKESIAGAQAFQEFVTEETSDVDRKLQQIRRGLAGELGRDFDFYDPDIRIRWDPDSNLWDEFIRRANAMVNAGIIEIEGEKKYKSKIGEKLAAAREAILKNSPEWPQLLRAGLTGFKTHPLPWQASDRFRKWINASPDNAQALQDLWTEGSLSVTDRIRPFSSVLPRDVASRPGLFTNLTSVLLMGLDVEQYPPFKITAFKEAYERTGYDMPERSADEATLYEHALGFLDRVIEEAFKRGLTLRHRLDAQTIAYRTIVASLPEPPRDEEDEEDALSEAPPPTSDLPTLAAKLHLTPEFLREIQTLLDDKRQVIFQGPPGTGKTYVAQALAEHLAGSKDRMTLVQLHPSYAYEDFVQGFRPSLIDRQPGFQLKDGPLLRAAENARMEPNAKHFLVIDEINRGNPAKVFGELYFLLEYRKSEIRLQYSDNPFSLPDNLYIIGTMNTADRSIALVDLALRRRFYFVEFHPDDDPVKDVLRLWLEANAPGMDWLADVVKRANEKMQKDRHAAIGPSYFMQDNLDEAAVERIWKHSVLPYIEERRYGESDIGEFALDRLRKETLADGGKDGEAQQDGSTDAENEGGEQ